MNEKDVRHSEYYINYLKSDTWRQRRLAKLEQSGFRCKRCGERNNLEVHHLNYKRLGNEDPSDLIVLCQSCHWAANVDRKEKSSDTQQKLEKKRVKSRRQQKSEIDKRKETKVDWRENSHNLKAWFRPKVR
jgi:5-methylcytosine-specific restriction endonuclease McrA